MREGREQPAEASIAKCEAERRFGVVDHPVHLCVRQAIDLGQRHHHGDAQFRGRCGVEHGNQLTQQLEAFRDRYRSTSRRRLEEPQDAVGGLRGGNRPSRRYARRLRGELAARIEHGEVDGLHDVTAGITPNGCGERPLRATDRRLLHATQPKRERRGVSVSDDVGRGIIDADRPPIADRLRAFAAQSANEAALAALGLPPQ